MWALMGNQNQVARTRMASLIPPVIPPLGINLEHEASQRHEGIQAERGVGKHLESDGEMGDDYSFRDGVHVLMVENK